MTDWVNTLVTAAVGLIGAGGGSLVTWRVAASSAQRQVESARQVREHELAEERVRIARGVGVELLERVQELNSELGSMPYTTVEAGGPSAYSPEAAGMAREALAQAHRTAVTRLALVDAPAVRTQYQRLVDLVNAYARLMPAAGQENRVFLDVERYLLWVRHVVQDFLEGKELAAIEKPPHLSRLDGAAWAPVMTPDWWFDEIEKNKEWRESLGR